MIVSMGEGKQCVTLKLIGRGKTDHIAPMKSWVACLIVIWRILFMGAVGTGYVPGVDMP